MISLRPLFFPKPWGGEFIARHFKRPAANFGEAFILSTLQGQENSVDSKSLSEFLGRELPYLVKIIDAARPLSIQVHPNDIWAHELENSKGKSECWLVLSAVPEAGVYLGLKPGVSEENLRDALKNNRDVEKLLEFHKVKTGDFIAVPAGAIHAIGAGITILEIQQSSGITYRFWDWGQSDRELQIEKAFKVMGQNLRPGILTNIHDDQTPRLLYRHPDFEVFLQIPQASGWTIDLKTLEVHHGVNDEVSSFISIK